MKDDFWASLKGFCVLAGVVIVLWFGNYFAMPVWFPAGEGETLNAGTAGDMFGGLTALFSGLAFAGLITTLFMQRKELEYQRKELSQTREVFQIQRFENTFFGLIELFNQHVCSIDISDGDLQRYGGTEKNVEVGRAALAKIANNLPRFVEPIYDRDQYGGQFETREEKLSGASVIQKYNKMYVNQLETDLGPYFRLIYNILRHIEYAKLAEDEQENRKLKLVYSKILRSHLNSSEVKILLYNCVSVHGRGLKHWIEKHSMLKHIRREDYYDCKELVDLYDPVAFRFDERKSSSDLVD